MIDHNIPHWFYLKPSFLIHSNQVTFGCIPCAEMANSTKPLLPSLLPRLVDPLWHKVDQPRDENLELTRLEREQEQRLKAITKSYMDVPPIGKTNQETIDDDDDDDDEDDQDNDDNNDELRGRGGRRNGYELRDP